MQNAAGMAAEAEEVTAGAGGADMRAAEVIKAAEVGIMPILPGHEAELAQDKVIMEILRGKRADPEPVVILGIPPDKPAARGPDRAGRTIRILKTILLELSAAEEPISEMFPDRQAERVPDLVGKIIPITRTILRANSAARERIGVRGKARDRAKVLWAGPTAIRTARWISMKNKWLNIS
jgi:hypothetical protein